MATKEHNDQNLLQTNSATFDDLERVSSEYTSPFRQPVCKYFTSLAGQHEDMLQAQNCSALTTSQNTRLMEKKNGGVVTTQSMFPMVEQQHIGNERLNDDKITRLKMQLSNLEKKLHAKETESEDRGFRLSLLENVSYDGTMIWKIPQFAQRMVDAQSGKYTSIFSLPFYTSRYGYKLCLRLYILGDGIGKGTHMSLFFVVMRGEFDNILQWPFTYKVTFRLLNQSGGKDIVDSFLPDPMSSSFKKPKTDMNVASGCPRFVPISDIKSGGYIVDDTIFIKMKVDSMIMLSCVMWNIDCVELN